MLSRDEQAFLREHGGDWAVAAFNNLAASPAQFHALWLLDDRKIKRAMALFSEQGLVAMIYAQTPDYLQQVYQLAAEEMLRWGAKYAVSVIKARRLFSRSSLNLYRLGFKFSGLTWTHGFISFEVQKTIEPGGNHGHSDAERGGVR